MTLILHTGGDVVAYHEYVDLRLVGSTAWKGDPKFGGPIDDLVDAAGDPTNLSTDAGAIFPGTSTSLGVDCWEQNYPPYNGDTVLLGQRIDDGLGGPNNGVYTHLGVGAHNCAQIMLVYWNNLLGTSWTVPAHRIRINRVSGGVIEPWIPTMVIPAFSRRALFVMADSTVIQADTFMAPTHGLDDFPLRVPNDDNVWCSPLEFLSYDTMGSYEGTVAPCKRLQDKCNGQRINTQLACRLNLERNIVCGDPAKNGMAFVTLYYPFAQGAPADKFIKVALEARSCKYDGSEAPTPWVQLTPITGPDEFIDATGLVTPPGDGKLFDVKFLLGFESVTAPPPELELRFKRYGRHVDDNAEYVCLLAGGYGSWFRSPYPGPGL